MKPILLNFPMPIMTQRLLLKPPQAGDGVMLNAAILESFEALHSFMDWAKQKPSLEESEEYARQGAANWILKKCEEPWFPLYIFDIKTHDFIGATGFHNTDWEVPCVETGYWVRKKYSGQGFITEATNAITQYAFKVFQVKRIAITCDIDNERSKKVPERLGFHLESIMKANRIKPISGEVTNTLVFVRNDLINLPELPVTWG